MVNEVNIESRKWGFGASFGTKTVRPDDEPAEYKKIIISTSQKIQLRAKLTAILSQNLKVCSI